MFEGLAFCLDTLLLSVEEKKIPRLKMPDLPATVEEAFARDWENIGSDMYSAIHKVTGDGKEQAEARR